MKLKVALAMMLLMTILCMPFAYAENAVPSKVLEAVDSVVKIQAEFPTEYSTGTGFVVASDGTATYIATNAHVIEGDPYEINVWVGDNDRLGATIFVEATQKDLCILKLDYPVNLKALKLSDSIAEKGEGVYAVGFPGAADSLSDVEAHSSKDATITDGIVSAIREATIIDYGAPVTLLQISAAINSGNSGGPLFNTKGEVIGINTYGIDDSQGIFGAIAVDELISLLEYNGIEYNSSVSLENYIVYAAIIFGAVLIVVLLIVLKKNQQKKHYTKNKGKSMKLSSYMENYPYGLPANQIASLLYPVALQLLRMHDAGTLHLQISPETIIIQGNAAKILNPSDRENDRFANGFAAPEIYTNGNLDARADIYSLCAVMYYMATGMKLENALTRKNFNLVNDGIDEAIFETLRDGLEVNANDRTISLRGVCRKLHALLSSRVEQPVEMPVKDNSPKPRQRKKRKVKVGLVVFVALISVVVICIAGYFGTYFVAKKYVQDNDFANADKWLMVEELTQLHDWQLVNYINAWKLLNAGEYDEAVTAFNNSRDYYDGASEMALETMYRQAVYFADNNRFDEAIELCEVLVNMDYRDVDKLTDEILMRKGMYLLYEESDYRRAANLFDDLRKKDVLKASQMYVETHIMWAEDCMERKEYMTAYATLLKIDNNGEAQELLGLLTEILYEEGVTLYRSGNYETAVARFRRIEGFKDSRGYLALIASKSYRYHIEIYSHIGDSSSRNIVIDLLNYIYLEDANQALFSRQDLAKQYLMGEWRTADESYYFEMDDEGSISYNLPHTEYGDYYRIENGVCLKFRENERDNTRAIFEFVAIDKNTIDVYCYKNNRTYTLYRR